MNLFERLLHRRLCNEQLADGGAAPAASEPSAPGTGSAPQGDQPAQQDGENPSVDGEGHQEKTGEPGRRAAKPRESRSRKARREIRIPVQVKASSWTLKR
ncbi:hypothetical protein P5P93_24635 [Klebsiella pneumoniae]|nr:hypothetical protein P5P93_24635 [Klebsiella pneumoniae]